MQNRLTIKDIARLSGVGKSTVSRVLNNESGVSERTRERVEAVMQQHGFSPSRSARAMRGQSDKVVAIIVTLLDSLSENLAVQTMLPAFYEQGYDPIMMESQFSPALVEEHLGMLARRNIDGVVLFGFTGIDEAMLAPWRDTLVLMARDAPGFASPFWKAATSRWRTLGDIVPSRRRKVIPARASRACTRSSRSVNWLKTRLRWPSSRRVSSRSRSRSTLAPGPG